VRGIAALAAAVLLGLSAVAWPGSPAPKRKKKAAPKAAAHKQPKSKYKFKARGSGSHYRFDSSGNPVRASRAEAGESAKPFESPKLNDSAPQGGAAGGH
jgi:hypothetical protein